uniref:Alpha-galactosidase n=1 Tax=Chromera velia CCMP2878 TaxID=1169474 RepID=A0A0G4HW64_9ALVE|eukprot:Cvel_32543.t1-p1 / transcript=Cvel_32543.t1 / gene=Cvel_32543 / organism=Chromera_velia_CCMP2878 / gene_product=Alpha-N-acetylgalactosaminidase, putative / transcript_product=Alpha-N-acetylgalactosaminidase, putative / location=Cvel_scaffold5086:2961-5343(-) / protein_length=355 / sequence_SO=supercontig / SO=protein_coding / is_pseudo=false
MRDYYSKWSSALVETGRDIVFSCSWPAYVGGDKALREFPWGYISRICNLWRLYDDINPSWGSLLDIMKHWRNTQDYLITAHGPSALNDPDMLEVGNPEVPATQARAQMSVWSVLAAPLLMGHDVRKMDAQSLAILSNDEVIAVNQDLLVRQGKFVRFLPSPSSSAGEATTLAVWRRELFNGDVAVAVVNEGEEKQSAEISWSEDLSVDPKTPFRIRDLWGHLWVTAGARGGLKVSVDPHDAVFLRFVPDPLAPSASSVRGHSRGVFSSWASELSGEGVSRTVLPSEEIGSRVDLAALAARSDPAEIRWREEGRARWQAAAKSGERKEERETGDEEGTKREERERKEPSVPVVLEM